MKSLKNLLLITVCTFLIVSCQKKPLDLYEPYKDVTVVYGLLNPADSIQYIKIYKGFLGSGDANDYAQVSDSIYYPADDLKVELVELKFNNTTGVNDSLSTIVLHDTLLPATSTTGTYTSQNNLAWCTYEKISGNGRTYKLKITNLKSGKVVSSQTNMVDLGNDASNFVPKARTGGTSLFFFDQLGKTKTLTIGFNRGDHSNLFNLVMRIYYLEYTFFDKSDAVEKYIDLPFDEKRSVESAITFSISGSEILNFIRSRYSTNFKDSKYSRSITGARFYLSVGSEDFTTYMDLNSPRTGYLLDKPLYTNITNGYGLFANRYGSNSIDYTFEVKTLKTFEDSLAAGNFKR